MGCIPTSFFLPLSLSLSLYIYLLFFSFACVGLLRYFSLLTFFPAHIAHVLHMYIHTSFSHYICFPCVSLFFLLYTLPFRRLFFRTYCSCTHFFYHQPFYISTTRFVNSFVHGNARLLLHVPRSISCKRDSFVRVDMTYGLTKKKERIQQRKNPSLYSI